MFLFGGQGEHLKPAVLRRKGNRQMRVSAKFTAWLLPFVLTGCSHWSHKAKNQPVAPPLPPPATIGTEPVDLPPAATSIPPQPTETAKTPSRPPSKPAPRRKPQPPPQQTAKNAPEVAASAPTAQPAVSAIGQLSSGDPANSRQDTEDSILSIERGLNNLNRSLDDNEQKTADHIREFLKQARQALGSGDVDGAHNLAAKAKVLLDELTKP